MRSLLFVFGPLLLLAVCLASRRGNQAPTSTEDGTKLQRFGSVADRCTIRKTIIYLVVMVALLTGALTIVSVVARARFHPSEVLIALWFTIGWRLAAELWSGAINKLRADRLGLGSRNPWLIRGLPFVRISLTAVVFAPLFAGCVLTHRLKLTDGQNPQSVLNLDYETIRFTSADGLELAGWFIPHENNYRTVIICHGAGANKGNFAWFLVAVAEHANVLMFDFRAHGASDGRVTTYGISEKNDVIGAVDWLKANRPDGSESIIGLGSSQGALALALAAAEDQRIDAVILDSPFVSPRELAHHHADRLPVAGPFMADVVLAYMSLLSGADFFDASAERAVQAMGDRPLLIIHGDEDFAMPAAHARRIHRAAAGPATLWLGPGPHSNIVTTAPDAYESRVAAFIAVVDPLQAYRHEDSVLKCLGSTSPP